MRMILLRRLHRAGGHIHAVERHLWGDTGRGLWSLRQAVARLAEVWACLQDEALELPVLEKSLPPDLLDERLAAWAAAPRPATLEAAWRSLQAAEAAVRAQPFPTVAQTRLDAEGRARLLAGIARKNRLIEALTGLQRELEQAYAGRYIAVAPGDRLRAHDGEPAVCIGLCGVALQLFLPGPAARDLGQAVRAYDLRYVRGLIRLGPGPAAGIGAPATVCLDWARHYRRQAAQRLSQASAVGYQAVAEALHAALDATAKAWWSCHPLHERGIYWEGVQAWHTRGLAGQAPTLVVEPLLRVLDRLERLDGLHREPQGPAAGAGWSLELMVALEVLDRGIEAMQDVLSGPRPGPDRQSG